MIKINEIFGPTIQGEGKSAGKEVLFIRTSLCNLYCVWCDTAYTWQWMNKVFEYYEKDHPLHKIESGNYNPEIEVHNMDINQILEKVEQIDCKSVVISGGEPLIQHKALTLLVRELKRRGYWVEVETNGTIYPSQEFISLIDQINCSPKLENSGVIKRDRENERVLDLLSKCLKVNFKFVVSSEKDAFEILGLVNKYNLKDVYLMPLGMTNIELSKTQRLTRKLCEKYSFKFSDRLHITLLGGGRGI